MRCRGMSSLPSWATLGLGLGFSSFPRWKEQGGGNATGKAKFDTWSLARRLGTGAAKHPVRVARAVWWAGGRSRGLREQVLQDLGICAT